MSLGLRPLIRTAALVVVVTAGLGTPAQAMTPYRSTVASSVDPASGAPRIACAARDLEHVRRGVHVRLIVHLATTTATLTATSRNPRHSAVPNNALLHHGVVVVHASGSSTRYQLPTSRFFRPRAEYVAKVRAHGGGGYLCLVRFRSGEAPVAVVAVNPGCMGGCPDLVFVPSAGARRSIQAGPGGSSITTSGRSMVLVTDDPRYFGVFSDDAESVDPLRIFTFGDGRLINVTSHHRARLRHDANRDWGFFRHPGNGAHTGLGALAAWAADECSLGRQAFVFHTLAHLLHAHRLTGSPGSPGGAGYVKHLRKVLVRTGYAT
jgi:hypothetical protein